MSRAETLKNWDEVRIAILSGVLIAFIVTLTLTTLRPALVVLTFVGLIISLPTLVIKEVKRYWLVIYIILLLFDVSKRLTTDLVHPNELFQMFGLPPSGNLSIHFYVSDLVLFGLVLSWFLRILTRKEQLYFPKIAYIPLVFLLWALLSSVFKSRSFYLSFFELFHQTVYFITALYIANNVNSKALVKGIIFACLFVMVLESIAVVVMFIQPSRSDFFEVMYRQQSIATGSAEFAYATVPKPGEEATIRSRGTFVHPGSAALFFQFFLPLTLMLLFADRTWGKKCLYFLLFSLASIALALTFSRSGFLGAASGMVFALWAERKRNFLSRKQYAVVLAFIAICLLVVSPRIYSFLTSRPEAFSFRFTLMEKGINTVLENPILGVGLNNSSAAHPDFRIREEEGGFKRVMAIHNQYLITAIDTGIIGLILYVSFLVIIVMKAYQCSKTVDRDVSAFSIAIGSSYIAVAVIMNADPFGGHVHSSLLWIYAGLITAFEKMERSKLLPSSTV